jgi:protocatechuate 3,4-dioxygenase beta subunit
MDRRMLLVRATAFTATLTSGAIAAPREAVIGGRCEGCEWVFDDQPGTLGSLARIAPANQPGSPMVIKGTVTTLRGAPTPGVIVYAYHTDQTGIYPPAANRHGSLRGWALTDAQGRYRFDTIRPGAYPSRNVPEHVHMHVIEPGIGTYYIDNLEFEDDPLNSQRGRTEQRGGDGFMLPVRRDGVWQARRDIVLGRNIPGYPPR